jgi:hypothetical protein
MGVRRRIGTGGAALTKVIVALTLLGGAAIFVYLLSRTFFPMAVRTYSSC